MGKIKDYLIYGVLGILLIISLVLMFSGGDSEEKDKPTGPTEVKEELVLDTYKVEIKVNTEGQIIARVNNNPSATISYISMDNTIVEVYEDGRVRGLKPGSAYVKVSYQASDGSTQSKNCFVNVTTDTSVVIEELKLPDGDLVLKVGDTYKVEYQVSPPSEYYVVKYQSTDPSIASIDEDGNLVGLKEGIIAVRVTVNNTHVDKMVYVTNKDYPTGYTVMPTKIVFKSKSMKIKLEDESEIAYSVEPEGVDLDNYATWTSSDESVVSVDKGKIKGLAVGTSEVTLETINGIKITSKITVSPKEIKAEDIKITSGEEVTLEVNGTSDITYELTPEDTTDKITFTSSNESIAKVSSQGKITAVAKGECKITVKAGDITKDIAVTVKKSGGGGDGGGGGGSGRCKISSDPMDETYNSCFRYSHHLTVSQSSVTVAVGSSVSIKVGLPKECGTFIKYTRTSADGSSGWGTYIGQSRSNINSSGFTWIITGRKKGSTTASQTVQFDAQSPSGKCSGNVKSMITVKVTVK